MNAVHIVLTVILGGINLLLGYRLVQALSTYRSEVLLPDPEKTLSIATTVLLLSLPLVWGIIAWRRRHRGQVPFALLLGACLALYAVTDYRQQVFTAQQQKAEFGQFLHGISFLPVVVPDTATLTPARYGPYTGFVTALAGVLAQQRDAQAAVDRLLAADRIGGRLFALPTFASTAAIRTMRRDLAEVRALLEARHHHAPLQEALTALQRADGPAAVRDGLCADLQRTHAAADTQAQAAGAALLAALAAADDVYAHLAAHADDYAFTGGRLQFHVTATASRHMRLLAAANAQFQRHQQLHTLRPHFTAAVR